MKLLKLSVAILTLVGVFATASAMPPSAATCVACHGPDGNSPQALYPVIAGKGKAYIADRLNAFKTGKMTGVTVMTGMVATLTPANIEEISVFFGKTKCNKKSKRCNEAPRCSYDKKTKSGKCLPTQPK